MQTMDHDPKAVRRFNFSLLRHLRLGHANLVTELQGVAGWNEISKFATGDRGIGDYAARAIEKKLNLPEGWLDRDHAGFLKAGADVYGLFSLAQRTPPNIREAVRTILEQNNRLADGLKS